jgi:hypothetical protein
MSTSLRVQASGESLASRRAGRRGHRATMDLSSRVSAIVARLLAARGNDEEIFYLAPKIMLLSYLTSKLKIFPICPKLEFSFPI